MNKEIIEMPDGEGIVTMFNMLLGMGKLGVYYSTGKQITFNTELELKQAEDELIDFFTLYD